MIVRITQRFSRFIKEFSLGKKQSFAVDEEDEKEKKAWREKRNPASVIKKNRKQKIAERRLRESWPTEWFLVGFLY